MYRGIWGACIIFVGILCGVTACTFGESAQLPSVQEQTMKEWELVTYVPADDAEHLLAKRIIVKAPQMTPKLALKKMLEMDAKRSIRCSRKGQRFFL